MNTEQNLPTIDPQDYGLRLKNALKERHMRQYQLAEMIGVKETTISAYTKGSIKPSIDNMLQIAYVLNKPLDYFLKKPTKMEIRDVGQVARLIKALATVDGINVEMHDSDVIVHFDTFKYKDLLYYLEGIIQYPLSKDASEIEKARFNAWNREELERLDELKL